MYEKKIVGTFSLLGSPNVMECLGRTGMDFVIIDTEHNCYSPETVENFIRAAETCNILPFVRIGDFRRPYVLQMLDMGARGLVVPNITSVDEVETLVKYGKFAPVGNRGFSPTRFSGWLQDPWAKDYVEYMKTCNERCKLYPQCETIGALECIEEIAAMDGVDGIFVGPGDLSIALGVPLQFEAPVLLEAIDRILNACKKNNKDALIYSGTVENARYWLEKGFDGVAYRQDTAVFQDAFKDVVSQIKD